MAKLKTHGFGIILDEQSLLVPCNVCLLLNNILLESIEFVGKSGSTLNICLYYIVAAFIAAALCCRICSPETGHSASQHKQRGEVGTRKDIIKLKLEEMWSQLIVLIGL